MSWPRVAPDAGAWDPRLSGEPTVCGRGRRVNPKVIGRPRVIFTLRLSVRRLFSSVTIPPCFGKTAPLHLAGRREFQVCVFSGVGQGWLTPGEREDR
ncbi:hypothetical protein DPEC_G00119440 [Dallia pectoralis]|uniref:Uncharacterized protein n=1 Tax=Dallia pectoralis TaxID=75939 RepID=A0ACC2GPK5_DALPE|nr:hypothetical protein DPEC_G00119440 [Dallia pectoralis]